MKANEQKKPFANDNNESGKNDFSWKKSSSNWDVPSFIRRRPLVKDDTTSRTARAAAAVYRKSYNENSVQR